MRRLRPRRLALHAILLSLALVWLVPIIWTLYTSLRPRSETAEIGYLSLPHELTLDNFGRAAAAMALPATLAKTALIVVPAVVLTLILATFAGFAIARFSWRLNFAALVMLTAANLLPQQSLLIPLFRFSTRVPLPFWLSDSGKLYDSFWILILVNTAFQTGFCTFVLSNYIKTLPKELYEAAMDERNRVSTTAGAVM